MMVLFSIFTQDSQLLVSVDPFGSLHSHFLVLTNNIFSYIIS